MVSQAVKDIANAKQTVLTSVAFIKEKMEEAEQAFLDAKYDYYTAVIDILESNIITRKLLSECLGINARDVYRRAKCYRGECITKSTTKCLIAGHLKNNWKSYKKKEG